MDTLLHGLELLAIGYLLWRQWAGERPVVQTPREVPPLALVPRDGDWRTRAAQLTARRARRRAERSQS